MSYTLSRVEESFLDLEPGPFPASHDQLHELKVVHVPEFRDWHLSET